MKHNPVVFLDIDGVLADFEAKFCENFGWQNRQFFSLERRYPDKKLQIAQFVMNPSTYAGLNVVPLGWKVYAMWKSKGYGIVLISNRPADAYSITERWLKHHGIIYDALILTQCSKLSYAQHWKPIFAIDDMAETVMEYEKHGIVAACLDQPWNRQASIPRIKYLHDLEEFLPIGGSYV